MPLTNRDETAHPDDWLSKGVNLIRDAAAGSVLEASPHYRTAIGILGVALSPTLILGWLILAASVESSISAYYYTGMRDWFVGTLWVIGVFLFFYTYRPRATEKRTSQKPMQNGAADAWLGKVAGLSAVVVALFPTTPPPLSKDVPPTIGYLHGVAAATLFLCLALFPLLLFSQSRGRAHVYRRYGWAMLGVLVVTVAYVFAPSGFKASLAALHPILVLETALIVLFGASWFAKGWEMAVSENRSPEQQREREVLPALVGLGSAAQEKE